MRRMIVGLGLGVALLGAMTPALAQKGGFWEQALPWQLVAPPQVLLDVEGKPLPEVMFWTVRRRDNAGAEYCLLVVTNSALGQMNTLWTPCEPEHPDW